VFWIKKITPLHLPEEQIEEELLFIPEAACRICRLTWDDWPPRSGNCRNRAGIKYPPAPAPNTMSTGLVIQVPEYLTTGEKIRIISKSAAIWCRAD
jgi:elongation factor P